MKTFLRISFFVLVATQICFGQWFAQNSGTTKNLNAVKFIDANSGFAVGDSGTIIFTSDGGMNWVEQTSGTTLELFDVCFMDVNNGWAVGGKTINGWGDSSVILHTTNRGMIWESVASGAGYGCFFDCCFSDVNNGTIVGQYDTLYEEGSSLVIKTTDGGLSWFVQNPPLLYQNASTAVHFNNLNTGWTVTVNGSMGSGSTITKTTDGGTSWQIQLELPPHAYSSHLLKRIKFSNDNNGFAVGSGSGILPKINRNSAVNYSFPHWGLLFFTTDGGTNWINADTSEIPTLPHPVNDIHLTGLNTAIAVGDSGDILQVTYSIGGWTEQISNTDSALNGVSFVDNLTGWVVGDGGTVLHTTNGGVLPVELVSFTAESENQKVILRWTTATELNNNGFEVQRSAAESDFATIGFVRGEGTTTNQKQYSYIDKDLVDGKYYYRLKQVDYNGTYEYSDVIEVDVRSLNEYALEQNFPNPFNPTTIIGYVLKEKTIAKLILLNAIGEEVAVLVNGEQDKGYHKVDFNASTFASGVYFYQLRAGSFVQTKKMLLIK